MKQTPVKTNNSLMLKNLRVYFLFLSSLKGLFSSFVENKATKKGGNNVTRIAYGLMAGPIFMRIAIKQFIIQDKCTSAGKHYLAPESIEDFDEYIRKICSPIECPPCFSNVVYDNMNQQELKRWVKYLNKLKKEEMSNRTAVAYAIPYDAITRKCTSESTTFVNLLSFLSPRLVAMWFSDTFFKKRGFSEYFGRKRKDVDVVELIEDSCLRSGFLNLLERVKTVLELLEKQNQNMDWATILSIMDYQTQGILDSIEKLDVKSELRNKKVLDALEENDQESEDESSEDDIPLDAWKELPFARACISVKAAFNHTDKPDFLVIPSVDKFVATLIDYLKNGENENVKKAICNIPTNENLSLKFRSRQGGTFDPLSPETFKNKTKELRTTIYRYLNGTL